MPPGFRRLLCSAIAVAAFACPAAAQATATGGAAPPPAGSPGSAGERPTGGAIPARATWTPHKAQPAKKRKKRKKPPTSRADGPGAADIPSGYLRLYHAAGVARGVSWRVLAAIGKNESDHGRSTLPGVLSGVNFAGCCAGPMQLCVVKSCGNTWSAYAVDADGDGQASVYDPADAIYAAAGLVHDLQAMFGNHEALILAGYNAGPGNVIRYGGVPPFAETQAYVTRGRAYMVALKPVRG